MPDEERWTFGDGDGPAFSVSPELAVDLGLAEPSLDEPPESWTPPSLWRRWVYALQGWRR